MIVKTFVSDTTHDSIEVNHFIKSHKATFKIVNLEEVSENIRLVDGMVEYLKENDIKWVIIKSIDKNYVFPTNCVWFKNKKTGDTNCHIEDFQRFYLANMDKFFELRNIYLNEGVSDDGWTRVVNPKRERAKKIRQIEKEINALVGDWNSLSH